MNGIIAAKFGCHNFLSVVHFLFAAEWVPCSTNPVKMKTILLLACCVFAAGPVLAQTSDAEAEAMVNLLGVQKKEIVAKLVPLTKKDSAAFWKVYDEYQQLNKATAKARIKLYERTAMAYASMTPATADSLATQYFANRQGQEKTLETYYKKMKAATNAVIAFEFYQAETYLLTQLRATIMAQIPTYGEVQQAIKNN